MRDPAGRVVEVIAETGLGDTASQVGYGGLEPATVDQVSHGLASVLHDPFDRPQVEVDADGERWLVSSLNGELTAMVRAPSVPQ